MLKEAKNVFLKHLAQHGIVDNDLVVARMRKPRERVVGYYCAMSQFRSKPRVVVNVSLIESELSCSPDLVREEVLKTIAHEYGHLIAEALRVVGFEPGDCRCFQVPDWRTAYQDDEEGFAEDFARFIVTCDPDQPRFWADFMPAYTAEFNRIFVDAINHRES